jgi:hypothetical protein
VASIADRGRERVRSVAAHVPPSAPVFYWPPGHTFSTDTYAKDDCVLIEFSELADFIAMEKGLGRHQEVVEPR